MTAQLDHRIASLEAELTELRHRKIALLRAQVAAVEAALAGDISVPSARRLPAREGLAAGAGSPRPAEPAPKKRRRRAMVRVTDDEVLPSITQLLRASGKEGVSARKVADATGLSYPRVLKLMDAHFKKTGARKSSRYHLK